MFLSVIVHITTTLMFFATKNNQLDLLFRVCQFLTQTIKNGQQKKTKKTTAFRPKGLKRKK